jgi:multidrug efflux pump subunit AcrA (membrane-fusion protein)
VIPNPDQELRPGTNVTVRIESEVVKDTIAIPKDAVFRENGVFGVYLVSGDRLQWKPITQGISSVSRTEVKDLKDGDVVALRSDRVYRDGMQVQPAAE